MRFDHQTGSVLVYEEGMRRERNRFFVRFSVLAKLMTDLGAGIVNGAKKTR